METDIGIIPFTHEHLDGAVRLSQQFNWPHRKEDWTLMLSISEGMVAVRDGEVVGTALTTLFGEGMATSSMIIVDDAMQGRGLGRQLMDGIMSIAKARENRLIATDIGLPLYSKLGFEVTGRITQHQAVLGEMPSTDNSCEWDHAPDRDALVALDHAACGMNRDLLINALVDVGKVAIFRDGGAIAGFAIVRDFGRGQVVGPVVSSDIEMAKALLQFTFASTPGVFMRVDIPDVPELYSWLLDMGLEHVGKHVRMTLNPRAANNEQNVRTFALVSQALG